MNIHNSSTVVTFLLNITRVNSQEEICVQIKGNLKEIQKKS